jgi:hypothetical protein
VNVMTTFSSIDRDLHDEVGNHRPRPRGEGDRWNIRMEGHMKMHRRYDKIREAAPDADGPWDLGVHIPRQLRTPLAES